MYLSLMVVPLVLPRKAVNRPTAAGDTAPEGAILAVNAEFVTTQVLMASKSASAVRISAGEDFFHRDVGTNVIDRTREVDGREGSKDFVLRSGCVVESACKGPQVFGKCIDLVEDSGGFLRDWSKAQVER